MLKEKFKGFAESKNNGLEEVFGRVPSALVLERIAHNVFAQDFCAKVITVLVIKEHTGRCRCRSPCYSTKLGYPQ